MSNAVKNKRLAERDRDALLQFAKKQIAATEDRTTLDAAYERAADAIAALVRKENPPADMKVLAKYGLAGIDSCVAISSGERQPPQARQGRFRSCPGWRQALPIRRR